MMTATTLDTDDTDVISRETIPAGGRWSRRLETGQRLKIIDLEGQQAVDFLCYAADLPLDRMNLPNVDSLSKCNFL